MIITIDGPAASGKSSAARCLAQKLGFYYLYSGLLYRACAYVLIKYGGYGKQQLTHLSPEAVSTYFNVKRIRYVYTLTRAEQIFFDGVDITHHLKAPAIDDASSLLSANPFIRHAVSMVQHAIGMHSDIVADGRDMGTVVFPKAEIKFFLTASAQERVARWRADQEKRGHVMTLEEAFSILSERDHRDTIRAYSPLSVAQGAIMIDNTDLSAAQTCERMEREVRKVYSYQ